MFSSLGSLSRGKLADFIIYPPGVDLLEDNILRTRNLQYVARGRENMGYVSHGGGLASQREKAAPAHTESGINNFDQ